MKIKREGTFIPSPFSRTFHFRFFPAIGGPLSESLKQAYVVCEKERLEGVKYNRGVE